MRELGVRAFVCALAIALAACDAPQTETPSSAVAPRADESLEALVPSLVDAVQAKQTEFVMDHVAQDFEEDGGLDYFDVRALVEKFALAEETVGARLERASVTPDAEGRQRVSTQVAFALGQRLAKGDSLPEGGVVYAIELTFEKRDGRWLAVGGRYKREVPPATSPATPPAETR